MAENTKIELATHTINFTGVDPKAPFSELMVRVGKHAAGRLLDGRTWDEYPAVQP